MSDDKKTQQYEWNEKEHFKNWRAWGSWFSWGSPVGLGLFFVLTASAIWIMASIR